MSNANITKEKEFNILHLSGHIDSVNAGEVEQAVMGMDDGSPMKIDLEQLEYISSAGLRILLRLRKKHPEIELYNASPSVYEILDVTGFTDMMPVARAYRKISIDNAEVIGEGANGRVYRVDPDTVVKVYLNEDSLAEIERERTLARKALILGIPTAISYDVVRVGDHFASMFEMINANSFSKLRSTHPEKMDEIVPKYADLLHIIHSTEVPDDSLPDQKAMCIRWLERIRKAMPEKSMEKLEKLLRAIPDSHNMIHGDCHAKNIMLANGEVILIDMDTIATGDPIFEFGFMYNAYHGYSLADPDNVHQFLGIPLETTKLLLRKVIARYYNNDDENFVTEKYEKCAVVGLIRVLRHALKTDDRKELAEKSAAELCRLIDKYDSLT